MKSGTSDKLTAIDQLTSFRRIAQMAVNYRKLAFAHYKDRLFCTHCGFGIPDVLEVAHLDCDRGNNDLDNLVVLCPTCHKMFDLDLISLDIIKLMREPRTARWAKRMKDAGKKAARSRKQRRATFRRKRRLAALKAVATRLANRDAKISGNGIHTNRAN
jgi:hypothetical protein